VNVLMALGIHGHPHPMLVQLAQMDYNADIGVQVEEEGEDIEKITALMKARIIQVKI